MRSMFPKHAQSSVRLLSAMVLLSLAYSLLAWGLSQLPLEETAFAIDWKGIWQNIQGGKIRYGPSLRNPPWSLLPILPLGFLPLVESWALLSLGTFLVMIKSVPRVSNRLLYMLGVLLLISSNPAVRHMVDGNVEGVVLAGLLLLLFGYRAHHPTALAWGILLASAKPQETWLVLPVVVVATLRHWPGRSIVRYSAIVALVALPPLAWYNVAWVHAVVSIEQRGSLMDSSLIATLTRLSAPSVLIVGVWGSVFALTLYALYTWGDDEFSPLQAAFLVAAGLMLAPYAAGNSLVTVVALGAVPLFLEAPWLGLLLLAATDAQYFFSPSFRYHTGASYVTAVLLLSWATLGVYVTRHQRAQEPPPA